MVMVKTEQQQQQKKKSSSSSVPIMTSSSSSSSNKMKKFKGVRMRSWGSWVSEIRAPNQKTRIWLGSYSTADAAARAYDAALLCLRGASSANNLNFPASSYHNIPNDINNISPKTIQRVAASAANNSPPSPSPSLSSPSPSPSPSPLEEASSNSSHCSDSQYSPQDSFFDDFNWCGDFDELRYVDHDRIFCDDYLLPFDHTAMVDYSYEESGDIRLWSFC